MTEDFLDVGCRHPGGGQMRCVRVTEGMGRGPNIEPCLLPMELHDFLHAALRERTVTSILKERGGGRGAEPPKPIESEHFLNALLGLIIKRNHPAARAFRNGGGQMQELTGLAIVSDEVK